MPKATTDMRLNPKRRARSLALKATLAAALLLAAGLGREAWRSARAPRAWAAGEVPVAFWSWRTRLPSEEAVAAAARAAGARELFARAGQFDFERGEVRRIRPAEGRFVRALDVHLVYNGTRSLLANLERVGENALAAAVAETYADDSARARRDGARVVGLQLDIDAPTRLLPLYARVLRAVRARVPADTKLSVTGLTTWMESPQLAGVLDAVDFWVPQMYGARVPERLDERTSIASPRAVAREAERAARLGKPFYAGLAAYGYAILYSNAGALLEVRGDLDPSRVARDPAFELIERAPFETRAGREEDGGPSSSWRYVYRAQSDAVVDGMSVRAGETLVFDLPSGASLRACVRGVRAHAGASLLGICIFRLPEPGRDPATLTLEQIAAALGDARATPSADLTLGRRRAPAPGTAEVQTTLTSSTARTLPTSHETRPTASLLPGQVFIRATNSGAADSLYGDDAVAVTLRFPAGSLRGVVALEGFTSAETLCAEARAGASGEAAAALRPCGLRRASALRLKSPSWRAGETAEAVVSFEVVPAAVGASVAARLDDGRAYTLERTIRLESGDAP